MHNWWVKFNQLKLLDKVSQLLIFAIVYTLPINLFYKFSLEGAYVRGLLVDYLIPKIYLHQIFMLLLLVLHWPHPTPHKFQQLSKLPINKNLLLGAILFILLFLRQFVTANYGAALSYLFSLTLPVIIFDLLQQKAQYKKAALLGLILALITQSSLAVVQFIKQDAIFPYQILGESNLHNLANISKGQFGDIEKILPYASTAHPNILAGFVVIFSILIWQSISWKNVSGGHWKWSFVLITNLLLIIFLTQSWSAALTLVLYGLWYLRPHLTALIGCYAIILCGAPLLIGHLSQQSDQLSLTRRAYLNQAAWQMWLQHPITGVGLNQFTLSLEKYANNPEIVRFVQPVHNSLLLVLSEGGLLFLLVLLYLVRQVQKQQILRHGLILLAIFSLDHYLLTQSAGWSLLLIFTWLIKE